MSPEADALVDRCIATLTTTMRDAPKGESSLVLSALVSSMIDSVIASTSDPQRAAQVLVHYITDALADRGCPCEVVMEGVPAIAVPHVH